MRLLIGLDIGTTGSKAMIFNEEGQVFGRAMREYGVDFPKPTWAEQDAENVWQQSQDVLAQVIRGIPVDSEVAKYLKATHGRQGTEHAALAAHYDQFHPYQFLAYKFNRMGRNMNYIDK